MKRILIATDLDRTLLPNGEELESKNARALFSELAKLDNVALTYVSGRSRSLVEDAITEYQLPKPDFIVADVGASIYHKQGNHYKANSKWRKLLLKEWQNATSQTLITQIASINFAELQDQDGQGEFKISYNVRDASKLRDVQDSLHKRLSALELKCGVISSINEVSGIGLIDVLPATANKLTALRFIMSEFEFAQHQVVFSGDSGNDIAVLESNIPSTLVANATEEVRRQAMTNAEQLNTREQLYLAKGMPEMNLNGNYSAGILEGVLHYHPELKNLIMNKVSA